MYSTNENLSELESALLNRADSAVNNVELNEWDDIKVFRDPVHQYTETPKAYVRYLIDTYDMQRIKNVAQSGLRSVYNAATHDRFSHSMGVYHLGTKAFQSLKKNILNIYNKENFIYSTGDTRKIRDIIDIDTFHKKLNLWELLFNAACILHDIGHPATSHTLEFLYDDIYLDLDNNSSTVGITYEEFKRYTALRKSFMEGKNIEGFRGKLAKKLLGAQYSGEDIKGNPHERMSAYYILLGLKEDHSAEEGSLTENIFKMLKSRYNVTNDEQGATADNYNVLFEDYLKFMCRMIIGQPYDTEIKDDDDIPRCFDNSIKNAIIRLLNGQIDVDSLDYIARNSYSAGYDTNNVDVNRMCTSYSVRLENNLLISVFEKSALSVLEGFISARNYEPSWLYSHHKIVYSIDVLYKCLYKCAVDLLYHTDLDDWSDIIIKNFFGAGKPIETNLFYKKYLFGFKLETDQQKAKRQKKSLYLPPSIEKNKMDKIAEIIMCLAVSNARTIENTLADLAYNDSDERNISLRVYHNVVKIGELTDKYNKAELLKDLDKLISEGKLKKSMKQSVIKYIENKKRISNTLAVILSKRNQDILDCSLKHFILMTRAYLFSLLKYSEAELKKHLTTNDKKKFFEFIETLAEKYSELIDIKNLYFSYLLSPIKCFDDGKYLFYRSNDNDIDALFKHLYFQILAKKSNVNETKKTFKALAEEYFNRTYKRSLWKSYQEYEVFIDEIAKDTGISSSTVNRYFIELIRKGGKKILFQNDKMHNEKSAFSEQCIFMCYSKEEFDELPAKLASVRCFNDVFKDLNDCDLTIRIHSARYKDFRSLVKVAFKANVFSLGDVMQFTVPTSVEFPYIYVNIKDGEKDLKDLRNDLKRTLTYYCVRTYTDRHITKRGDDNLMIFGDKVKLFRDVVHGDIYVPRKFMPIIETRAFQRLRRIKQLSTADLVFPNATHTRFSHCIGTFYIMTLIVDHFKGIFQKIDVEYKPIEIDALLAAALMHDIGHGPYSHNFERIPGNKKTHEEWSVDIIRNDPEIQAALKEFGYNLEEFKELIISYLIDNQSEKKRHLSFHTIFKSLISSQMDADRFDYLLRDSFNTGIGYGKIDVSAIINGMRVTEYKNKFYVCISESTVSYVEQFLFGRYKMYDYVYYSGYKVFSETLVLRILEYIKSNAIDIDESSNSAIKDLINNNISLDKYIELDDTYMNGLFSKWQNSSDIILSKMCKCLFNRNGYKRIYVMNQDKDALHSFCEQVKALFKEHLNKSINSDDLKTMKGLIITERRFSAYKYDSEKYDSKIWVLTNDGMVKDIAEVSPMIRNSDKENGDTYKSFVYYNKDIMDNEISNMKDIDDLDNKKQSFLDGLDQLIRNSDPRNHIEIEEKYSCTLKELKKIEKVLEDQDTELHEKYSIILSKNVNQTDTYYDTEDMFFAKNQSSLRCRKKFDNSSKITIKAPTENEGFDKESQVARFEYEKNIKGDNLANGFDFIYSTLNPIFPDCFTDMKENNINTKLTPQLYVDNNRKKYIVKSKKNEEIVFSVCLDRVTFRNENKKQADYQIEVELESDYIHRVPMKFFTDEIEKLLAPHVKHEQCSKYIKGMKKLGLYQSD